ncbi:MAG TPA: formyltransferase family protein [Candidatus Saccharimonadales bacterium]|nr:formyltransferase family protein [Candidatus Saccharimonadales bacterium]
MKKNIYLILADEQLFHPHYVRYILRNLDKKNYDVVGITIAKDRMKKGLLFFLQQQKVLWGIKGFLFFVVMSISAKIQTLLKPHNQLSLSTIAKENGIALTEMFNVNSQEHLAYLKEKKIDIIVSSNGQIFKNELLALPKIACINRHTALLPKYGGVLPVFWAMMNNEKYFGVSIHVMTKKIDEGDIIYQEKIEFKHGVSLFKNYLKGFDRSGSTTLKALDYLAKNKVMKKYTKKEATYFTFPTFTQMRDFRKEKASFSLSDIKPFLAYYTGL